MSLSGSLLRLGVTKHFGLSIPLAKPRNDEHSAILWQSSIPAGLPAPQGPRHCEAALHGFLVNARPLSVTHVIARPSGSKLLRIGSKQAEAI